MFPEKNEFDGESYRTTSCNKVLGGGSGWRRREEEKYCLGKEFREPEEDEFQVRDTPKVSWTSGANNTGNFEVEYGSRGFVHGAGATVQVSATIYTISGLSEETEYDVYVRAP